MVNYTTVSKTMKDCEYNCCPGYYNCDAVNRKCVFDPAGGYPRQHCLENCPGASTGYQCDLVTKQCVLSSRPDAVSLEQCNANCGRNTVLLCVYQCDGWVYQTCIDKHPDTPGLICPNEVDETDHHTIAGPFTPDGASCLEVQLQCRPSSKCDLSTGVCTPKSGPPKRTLLTCPDSKGNKAHFLGASADLNIAVCTQYDCIHSDKPCYPEQCPSVAGEKNVCNPPAALHHTPKSELRARPKPSSSFFPELLNSPTLPWKKTAAEDNLKMFASQAQARHTAHWYDPASSKMVSLEYDVVHAPDVLLLSELAVIVGVDCEPDGRMLLWLNAADQEVTNHIRPVVEALRAKPLLSGGSEWECAFPTSRGSGVDQIAHKFKWTAKTIQRRVRRVGSVKTDGPHLTVEVFTEAAGIAEFYESANISFKTTAFPHPVHMHDKSPNHQHREIFKAYRSSVTAAPDARRKLHSANFSAHHEDYPKSGWWPFNAITHIVHDFIGLAKEIGHVVSTIVHIAVAILTGTVDYDHTSTLASIHWNYDKNMPGHVERANWTLDESATCVACFLDLEVGLHLDLHIHQFSLVRTAAWIEGQVSSNIDMTVAAEASYGHTFDLLVAVVKIPDITILIGEIPFVISVHIPVHAGYVLDFGVKGLLHARGKMFGNAKYGFQYLPHDTSASGGFQFIHSHSFSHEGSLLQSSARLSAQLDAYIMPVVDLYIDHLGGPNIGLKAFVEPVIAYETSSACSPTWGPASKYTFNWGLQLTLGASLDVTIGNIHVVPKVSWGPAHVFNLKWPLESGCIHLPSTRSTRMRDDELGVIARHTSGDRLHLFPGVAYSGQVTIADVPGCDRFLSIPVHFQMMNTSSSVSGGFPIWTSNEPHNWKRNSSLADTEFNVACVAQATYVADYGVFEVFSSPPGQMSVDFKNCTLDAIKQGYTIMSLTGAYRLSPDLASLTIDTKEQCIGTVKLSRQSALRSRPRKLEIASPDYVWGAA